MRACLCVTAWKILPSLNRQEFFFLEGCWATYKNFFFNMDYSQKRFEAFNFRVKMMEAVKSQRWSGIASWKMRWTLLCFSWFVSLGRSTSELFVWFGSAVPFVRQVVIHPNISVTVLLFGKGSFVLHPTAGVVNCQSKALLEWLHWVCLTAGVLHLEKWLL